MKAEEKEMIENTMVMLGNFAHALNYPKYADFSMAFCDIIRILRILVDDEWARSDERQSSSPGDSKMAITKKAFVIAKRLYRRYGSSSRKGYLFDIPPSHRGTVEDIVQCVLDELEDVESLLEEIEDLSEYPSYIRP